MTIYQFFDYIFTSLGMGEIIRPLPDLLQDFTLATTEKWQVLLSPSNVFSWLVYFGFAFAIWNIVFVFPYRLIKRLINMPKRTN